jgi:hypothetical protein
MAASKAGTRAEYWAGQMVVKKAVTLVVLTAASRADKRASQMVAWKAGL